MPENPILPLSKQRAGIKALSPTTVRQIGATQVLLNPISVVKELIDNALDARATAIFVCITINTISSIEVKDDGHGIPNGDRALICRRYHTSKIRDFDDLKELRGQWLGFRGEAMASLAEISGALSIMTRVEGDNIAEKLDFGRNGEVISSERISHPIGTTVKARNLFKNFPVRKQDALKHSKKLLAHTRQLMQAYALARPSARFQLRVLKAKDEKANFNYAPKPMGHISDAVMKVMGKSCASQCDYSIKESDGLAVHAFLPRPNAIGVNVANLGAFLSVDSRPIASGRGLGKKIFNVFKESLRKGNPSFAAVKSPFCYMNIICPPHSYDLNIEPAKDDVLFEDEPLVLGVIQKLLASFYDAIPGEPSTSSIQAHIQLDIMQGPLKSQDFDTNQLERHLDKPTSNTSADLDHSQWRRSMYGIDEEHLQMLHGTQEHGSYEEKDDEEGDSRAVELSNPWIIAKMNARVQAKRPRNDTHLPNPVKTKVDSIIDSSSPRQVHCRQDIAGNELLTPLPTLQKNHISFWVDDRSNAEVHHPISIGNHPHEPLLSQNIVPAHKDLYLPGDRQKSSESRSQINARIFAEHQNPAYKRTADLKSFCFSQGPGNTREVPHRSVSEASTLPAQSQRSVEALKNMTSNEDLWFGQARRVTPPVRKMNTSTPKPTSGSSRNPPFQPLFPRGTHHQSKGGTCHREPNIPKLVNPNNKIDIRGFFTEKKAHHHRHMPAESVISTVKPSINSQSSDDRNIYFQAPLNLRVVNNEPVKGADTLHQMSSHVGTPSAARSTMAVELSSHSFSSECIRPGSTPPKSTDSVNLTPFHYNNFLKSEDYRATATPTPGPSVEPLHRNTSADFRASQAMAGHLSKHVFTLDLRLSASVITSLMRKLSMPLNIPEWGHAPEDSYLGLTAIVASEKLREWAVIIDKMIVEKHDGQYEKFGDVDPILTIENGIRKALDEAGEEQMAVGEEKKEDGDDDILFD